MEGIKPSPIENFKAGRYTAHTIKGVDLAILPRRIGKAYAFIKDDHKSVVVWDPKTAKTVSRFSPGARILHMVSFRNEERLVVGDETSAITIWDPRHPDSAVQTLYPFGQRQGACIALETWPRRGGDWLAIGAYKQNSVKVWEGTGKSTRDLSAGGHVVALQALGNRLAVLTTTQLQLWEPNHSEFQCVWKQEAVQSSLFVEYPQRHLLACWDGKLICQDGQDRVCTWDSEGKATPLSDEAYTWIKWIRVEEGHVIGGGPFRVNTVDPLCPTQFVGVAYVPGTPGARVVKNEGQISLEFEGKPVAKVIESRVAEEDYQVAPLPGITAVAVHATTKGLLILDFRKGTTHKPPILSRS